MARLENLELEPLQMAELTNPVILVVDMVNGFAKQGALADPAISSCAAPIRKLIETSQAPVWFICDAHEPGCLEFDAFPAHCLKGSQEAEVIDELKDLAAKERTIYKNAISTFAAPDFGRILAELPEKSDVVVTGCCTDLCIEQLALPLQSWMHQQERRGSRVIVPADCVDTYHIEGVHDAVSNNEAALQRMKGCGVTTVLQIQN